jgi:signal transduction histidine kinase
VPIYAEMNWEQRAIAAAKTVAVLKRRMQQLQSGEARNPVELQLDEARRRVEANERRRELMELRAAELEAHKLRLEQEVTERTRATRSIIDNVTFGILLIGHEGVVLPGATRSCKEIFGYDIVDKPLLEVLQTRGLTAERFRQQLRAAFDRNEGAALAALPSRFQVGDKTLLVEGRAVLGDHGEVEQVLFSISDVTEKTRLEERLQNAQKMEAVGQLAAGVAHEVNTPIQFIGDGVAFLKDALKDLAQAWTVHDELFAELRARGALTSADEERIAMTAERADVDFLFAEAPVAAQRTLRGVGRVAEIVRALRAFSHPESQVVERADVNGAIRDAVIMASGEYKHVAVLTTELGELPLIECNLGELNQVFLNLIINATHAVAERNLQGLGSITITSRGHAGGVTVQIRDNGSGIPEAVRARIFEPFFTTKPLGKGTGQGLALAHTFITVHHTGQLTFETECGVGTTFTIELPLKQPRPVNQDRKSSSPTGTASDAWLATGT